MSLKPNGSYTPIELKNILTEAQEKVLTGLEFAKCGISGVRVSAAVWAYSKKDAKYKMFTGCNIEYSIAVHTNQHAEVLAASKAISEGYDFIEYVFVSSRSVEEQIAMCGECLQVYVCINQDCRIVVLNPDGSVKLEMTVRERNGPHGYSGRGALFK